ncbi:hypothetical protein [Proteiniclasticum sp.]|uniref:hypothetical protein n=1 Tax=Proteiniclasticum sp. TaxID=2053595 RepID=UPI0028A1C980|nr:hypothetical protein [Proteiniclasticum sp.]
MIHGLHKFREYFQDFKDNYVITGGLASYLLLDDAGFDMARATKDIDLVLSVEALTDTFISQFWKFVKAGGYTCIRKSTGKRRFYRFTHPSSTEFPIMLEILSCKTERFELGEDGMVLPMLLEDEIVSLSAILLNKDYYDFVMKQKIELNGLMIADVSCIIPLKARAWIDNKQRRENGEIIQKGDIKKHKNDIYKLSQLLKIGMLSEVPMIIQRDIRKFVAEIEEDDNFLKKLGIRNTTMDQIKQMLTEVYCINTKLK